MTKAIFKYKIEKLRSSIEMPDDAQILTAKFQNDDLVIWALVDLNSVMRKRNIIGFLTGELFSTKECNKELMYINTVSTRHNEVYHLFEDLSK